MLNKKLSMGVREGWMDGSIDRYIYIIHTHTHTECVREREREREFLKKISSRQPPVHNDCMDILLMDMDSMQVSNKINKNTMVTTATTTPHHNQPHTHFIVSI
jgi:hypothetical protein